MSSISASFISSNKTSTFRRVIQCAEPLRARPQRSGDCAPTGPSVSSYRLFTASTPKACHASAESGLSIVGACRAVNMTASELHWWHRSLSAGASRCTEAHARRAAREASHRAFFLEPDSQGPFLWRHNQIRSDFVKDFRHSGTNNGRRGFGLRTLPGGTPKPPSPRPVRKVSFLTAKASGSPRRGLFLLTDKFQETFQVVVRCSR